MNQEEITKIYETLAPMAGDYAKGQAEQIGMAQQSIGPMAANVMGQSKTAGLGNYTYNRLMRPQVDVMKDELMVQGYANQLNSLLSDALNSAKRNYNRRHRSGSGGGGGGTPGNTPSNGWGGEFETDATGDTIDRKKQQGQYQLFTVKGPDYPNGIQWKYTAGEGGGVYDTPNASYEASNGTNEIRRLIQRGNNIYNSNGENITSRFK